MLSKDKFAIPMTHEIRVLSVTPRTSQLKPSQRNLMRADPSLSGNNHPWSPLALLPKEHHRTLFLLVLSIAIYLPALFNGLVWDADLLIRHDPRLRDIRHIFDYFHQGIWGFDANRAVDYYRPLIGMLHTLEYTLFGTTPIGYNAVNLLLNAGVCLLAYQLLIRLLSPEKAFLGALIYTSLAIRAGIVYWSYSDSYQLVSIFILLATILFLDEKPATSFMVFLLALLTQESAVVFPGIVFVIAFCRGQLKRFGIYLGACSATVLLYLAARALILGPSFLKKLAVTPDPQTTLYLLAKYLKMFFLKDAAITTYGQDPHTLPEFLPFTVFGAILLIGLMILTMHSLRKDRQQVLWLGWTFLLMLPGFLLGKNGAYYFGEGTLFLSSLGIIVLLINNINTSNRLIASGIVLVVIINASLAFSNGKYWRSTETYLEKVLEFDSTFVLGLAGLGDSYYARGDYDNALKCYRKIIALNPWHLGAIRSIRQIEKIKQGQAPLQPAQ